MGNLKSVLLLMLKNKQKIDWYLEEESQISKKVAYNAALDDVISFIELLESGEVDSDYLEELKRQQASE